MEGLLSTTDIKVRKLYSTTAFWDSPNRVIHSRDIVGTLTVVKANKLRNTRSQGLLRLLLNFLYKRSYMFLHKFYFLVLLGVDFLQPADAFYQCRSVWLQLFISFGAFRARTSHDLDRLGLHLNTKQQTLAIGARVSESQEKTLERLSTGSQHE